MGKISPQNGKKNASKHRNGGGFRGGVKMG